MKTYLAILLAVSLAVPSVTFGHARHYHSSTSHTYSSSITTNISNDDSRNIDYRKKLVIITYDTDNPHKVKINDQHEMYVDGTPITLDAQQQKLVGQFYDQVEQVVAEAKEIGMEGAAIGIHGAAIAATALTGVVSMLFTSYTSDDLERDVERKAAKIEARADKLEARAEKLEQAADEVNKLCDQMEETIPALKGDI